MITVEDLKTPEARRPFLVEYLKLPREDSLDARTIALDLYTSKGRPARYVVNNLDLLAPNGKPEVPEVWSALENCEINFSHTPGGLPREQQLEWLRLVTEEKMGQQTASRLCWAEFQDEDGDETAEAEGEELGFLHKDARRELPAFLAPDDYRKAAEFNWEMLGHPDYPLPDIRIDRLPRAEVVIRVGIAVSTAFVLRVILQNGKDINGFDIRDDHTFDHIDPASEGNELTFGNTHPMIGFRFRPGMILNPFAFENDQRPPSERHMATLRLRFPAHMQNTDISNRRAVHAVYSSFPPEPNRPQRTTDTLAMV